MVSYGATLALMASSVAAVPLVNQKTFGHSVKNGPLPAHTEVTTFEHNCSTAPCTITQIHVPSIYPGSGDAWNWTHGILNFYVDGETEPSLSFTLLELAGESHFNNASDNTQNGNPGGTTDGGPWGIGMMGRTAKSGGVYSTVRIPFTKSIKSTIQAPPSAKSQSVYWMIIRGLEAHPVVLGDLTLPPTAKLQIFRVTDKSLDNLELVTLASSPASTSGAFLRVNFDAKGPSFGYLEACMRLVTDGATTPLFLSSGAEDFFLSASYFDEGMFKTENSGLTFFEEHQGTLGAYKTMTEDPVLFQHGMELIFRRCESTSGCGSMELCPNQYCPPNATAAATKLSAERQARFQTYPFDQEEHDTNLAARAARYGLDANTAAVAATATATAAAATNYSEYYVGSAGQTCTAVCSGKKLNCNFNMAPAWDPATMMKHLNVTNCWTNGTEGNTKVGMEWYAFDQPCYVPDKSDPNYNECMGFVGFPAVAHCDASYPASARVCRCTVEDPGPAPAPPPAPPAPRSAEVVYTTVVWAYVWDSADAVASAAASSQQSDAAVAMHTVAALAGAGMLTTEQEDGVVDAVLSQDASIISLLAGYSSVEQQARLVRHLRRRMGW